MINVNAEGPERRALLQFVHSNIKVMLEVFIDHVRDGEADDLEDDMMIVLPRDYVKRKGTTEALNRISELYEIVTSSVVRDQINPVYQHVLYHVMQWWCDIVESDDDSVPIRLSAELKEILFEPHIVPDLDVTDEFDVLEAQCFADLDFLEDGLSRMVLSYLRCPALFYRQYVDVELDDYLDLMPADLRERYERRQAELMVNKERIAAPARLLDKELVHACMLLQGDKTYWSAGEDQRTAHIARMLSVAGFHASDQATWGKSASGKSAGSVDILVCHPGGRPLSVIEAFNLDALTKAIIDEHLVRLFGYDANGLADNYVLIYSEAKDFPGLWNKYKAHVKVPERFLHLYEEESPAAGIRRGCSVHVRNDRVVRIHHIMVDFGTIG